MAKTGNDVWLDEKGNRVGPELGSKKAEELFWEERRVAEVRQRRRYYDGTQFDKINQLRAEALNTTVDLLPEHEKLHAYSTQIPDSVDFIASQMTESFQLESKDKPVGQLLLTALRRSPDLRSGDDDTNVSLTNVLRDALIAQDAPVHVRWDHVDGTAWPEFWDSEQVQFHYDEENRHLLRKVTIRQWVWETQPDGTEVKRKQRREWSLMFTGECVIRAYWEDNWDDTAEEEKPIWTQRLGIPFIPWTTLRVTAKNRKQLRGQSAITEQALRAADRYNAVEQVGYLIARYNSHGNLAVIGDGATLKAQVEEHINKDVADILTFPGGTAIQVLTLPTDAQMIEHQRTVLLDTIYGTFGLTRQDAASLKDMGQVTGYALEILNRKSDGTFNQIRNQFVGDFKALLNMILDMTAYLSPDHEEETDGDGEEDAPLEVLPMTDEELDQQFVETVLPIDPKETYSVRDFKIQLGSAYVVDEALTREDYVAKIISRREVLRKRGYSEPEIRQIEQELEDEAPEEPEAQVAPGTADAVNKALNSGGITNNGKTPERAAAGGKDK
jgi:hypothetical protein